MCSMIDSGEKGYKLPEQILFNSLVLYLTLRCEILHRHILTTALETIPARRTSSP